MSSKTFVAALKTVFAAVLLLGIAGTWYFTLGRKPKEAGSVPAAGTTGADRTRVFTPAKVLLLAGDMVAPKPVAANAEKASAASATPSPTPRIEPAATPAAVPMQPEEMTGLRKLPELFTGEKGDQLLAKRTERRFAKLRDWAARLNARRAMLKTPMQIEAFNEEAKKYHDELMEARAEAAAAQKAVALVPPPAAAAVR